MSRKNIYNFSLSTVIQLTKFSIKLDKNSLTAGILSIICQNFQKISEPRPNVLSISKVLTESYESAHYKSRVVIDAMILAIVHLY